METVMRRRALIMTGASFFAFFLFGALEALKGPTLPALLAEMGYSYSAGGTIVTGAYLGFLVACVLAGFISDRLGRKAVLVIAALSYIAGIAGYASANGFVLFAVSFFLVGFAGGAVELGCNYVIVDVQNNPGRYLNLLAFFYGAGAMLAPLYAGRLMGGGRSWRDVYLFLLPAVGLMLLVFIVVRYPVRPGAAADGFAFREIVRVAFTRRMLWVYVVVFAYVAAEIAVATWLVEYLEKFRGVAPDSGAAWLSLFFAGIMAGRFVGSFLVERIGELRIMTACSLLAFACIAIGLAGPGSAVFLLPLSGLFFSVILPTAIAYVSKSHQDHLGPLLGFLLCFIGVGGMAGPWTVGVLNDAAGLRVGLGAAAAFCLLTATALYMLGRGARPARAAG
ncbi:MAG: MFS transporter [Planctomycetota bacterium]|jgi:fucose permease|nr:MFS transporter [Planctomycetota bacterium]